jgi:hypothetical protein
VRIVERASTWIRQVSLFREPATIPTLVDSAQHSLEDPSTLVPIYALISEQLAGRQVWLN